MHLPLEATLNTSEGIICGGLICFVLWVICYYTFNFSFDLLVNFLYLQVFGILDDLD